MAPAALGVVVLVFALCVEDVGVLGAAVGYADEEGVGCVGTGCGCCCGIEG